jgi:membrane protease YdiL (CAAX protease family)
MSKDSSKPAKTPKSPEASPKSWRPWVGVIVGLLALFGSQIVIGIILSLYPVIRGWDSTRANNWLTNSVVIQFVFVALAETLTVVIIYYFLKRYKGAFKEIGIRRPKWHDPFYGILGLPVYLVIYFVALNIITHFARNLNVNEKQQLGFNSAHGPVELVLTFISLVILPPIAEEIVFRGIIYTSLKKWLPLWAAVIGTCFLFAAGHLPEGGSAGPLYVAAIDTFSLSLVLIYLREKTGGLWSSMTLHALKNGIAFVALFALHLT